MSKKDIDSIKIIPHNNDAVNTVTNDLMDNKTFDVPDDVPGCFGGYSSSILAKCVYCKSQLECARQTAGED